MESNPVGMKFAVVKNTHYLWYNTNLTADGIQNITISCFVNHVYCVLCLLYIFLIQITCYMYTHYGQQLS